MINPIFSEFIFRATIKVDKDKIYEKLKTMPCANNKVILDSTEPELQKLYQNAIDIFNHIHRLTGYNTKHVHRIQTAWANMGYSDRTEEAHTHREADLVGVYFLKTSPDCGYLKLYSNNMAKRMAYPGSELDDWVTHWNQYNGHTWNEIPEEGTFVVFPSWIMHHVIGGRGEPRVTIAINSTCKQGSEKKSS